MKKPKVKMQSAGARALLLSREVMDDIKDRAGAIANAAGPGFVAEAERGRTRYLGSVYADTDAARRAEAESRVLTRALDAGR